MSTVESQLTIFLNPSFLDVCGLEKQNNYIPVILLGRFLAERPCLVLTFRKKKS